MKQVNLQFDVASHRYYDDENIDYISATTLIGKYSNKFDAAYWSMYKALKANGYKVRPYNVQGRMIGLDSKVFHISELYTNPLKLRTTPDDFIKQWDKLSKSACDEGNNTHDFLEDSINESKGDTVGKTNADIKPFMFSDKITKHDLDKTYLNVKHPKIYNWLNKFIDSGWTLYAEKRIYSYDHKVAGMIDVLAVRGKQFCILDWKTNKQQIRFESGYFKKDTFGNLTNEWYSLNNTMKAPINHLPDSVGIKYSLQLSLYAYIMELWGYEFVGLQLCHIQGIPNEKGLTRFDDADANTKVLQISYLKQEIHDIFQERLKTIAA